MLINMGDIQASLKQINALKHLKKNIFFIHCFQGIKILSNIYPFLAENRFFFSQILTLTIFFYVQF